MQGCDGIGDERGGGIEFSTGRAAVAVGFATDGVEAFIGDAAGHSDAVAAAQGVDLGAGGETGDGLDDGGGVGSIGVVACWGDGFDGLADGEELDAIGGEGAGYGVEQFAQAGVIVENEQVICAALGIFEHGVKGRHLGFGVAQVDPAGARLAGHDVGAGGFAPATGSSGGAAFVLLLGERDFIFGGLLFGTYGSPDGVSHGDVRH